MSDGKLKKDPLQTGGTMGGFKRDIDKLANESFPLLGKSWVFVSRTRVKTWQGLFMLAFISGAFVSFVWSVSLEIESLSKASGQAALSMTSSLATGGVINVSENETFDVDLVVDTGGVNAVAVRAIVTYNEEDFSLTNWDMSDSIFASGNTCVYNGNPCQIIDNDTANGRISITLAKPSPGVNTNSGVLATLTFRALRPVSSSSNNILYTYVGPDNATDSDVIEEGGSGNDLLNGVSGIRALVGAPACTDYNYSDWEGTCQSNGTQTRTVTSGIPSGCSGGAMPVTTQSCTYTPPTCTSFTESGFGTCQPNGTQTQTVTGVPAGCTGGSNVPDSSRACTYMESTNNDTCTSFEYSGWAKCRDGKQTRSITSSSPSGCTGGSAVVERSCKGTKAKINDTTVNFSDSEKILTDSKEISFSGTDEALKNGGKVEIYREGKLKTTETPNADGKWSTKVKEKKDGTYEYRIRYIDAGGNEIEKSSEYRVKIDTEDPRITDLPLFLSKARGEKVWWEVKDNEEIDRYRYTFLGKSNSVKSKSFNIPANAPTGVHTFQLVAYDEAGNRTIKRVLIRVR